MGAYEATGALCAGRPVYAQAGGGDGAIWYYGSNWAIGQREQVGTSKCAAYVSNVEALTVDAVDAWKRWANKHDADAWAKLKVESAGEITGVVHKGGAAPMFGASTSASAPTNAGFGGFNGGFGGFGVPATPGSSADDLGKAMKAIAAVEAELARTIGLGVVKTLWVQLKRLRLGMLASGDAWVARHVEIRGPKGSGKRTAQHLVKKMGSALSLVCTRSEFTCKVLPAERRRKPERCRCCPDDGGYCVECDKPFVLWSVKLPPYTSVELASMQRALLEQNCYTLVGGLASAADGAEPSEKLVTAVELYADPARGAYAANDLLTIALSNRHMRCPLEATGSHARVLTPGDFGLAELSRSEMTRMRAAVEQEIEALEGCEPAKEFFEMVRQRAAFDEATKDKKKGRGAVNLNCVVTGNPGVGKTTFARLLFKFLRAYGMLPCDAFVEMNGLELKGKYCGETCPKVKDAVRSALGGMLFIDEAYALGGDGPGEKGDVFSREAVRTLLTELENHRTQLCVVFAGYRDKMNGFMRCDPGLPRRLPQSFHLPDYTPRQLVKIMRRVSVDRFDVKIADELDDARLEEHIASEHGHEISQHNAALAINLVEKAVNRMSQRELKAMQRVGSGAGASDSTEALVAADFGIDVDEDGRGAEEIAAARAAIDAEFEALVGMGAVKAWFKELRARVEYVAATGDRSCFETGLHMRLVGNPGVGKTTVARLIHRFLYAWGLIRKDIFSERNALELKGQYVGHTAPKVIEATQAAMGGTLFLDEAHALVGAGGNGDDSFGSRSDSFSGEAVKTLLTECENNRTRLCCIVAGYEKGMQKLMAADPGMARRFPRELKLDDYSPADLARIAAHVASTRFDLRFADGLEAALAQHIEAQHAHEIAEHNGGLAVNLVEAATGRRAARIVARADAPAAGDDRVLTAADFEIRAHGAAPCGGADAGASEEQKSHAQRAAEEEAAARAAIDAEIEGMIGMGAMKRLFASLRTKVRFVERGGSRKVLASCLNLRLVGSPGTGKTTCARLLQKFLVAYGLVPRDVMVETNALQLKGQYLGQTAPKVRDAVRSAMGGVLFLDEAHALAGDRRAHGADHFSQEAVRTLLTEVENARTGLCVVLCGYKGPMDELMELDPGLRRRFPGLVELEDYTPAELARIAAKTAAERFDMELAAGLEAALTREIATAHAADIARLNASLPVDLVEAAVMRMTERVTCAEEAGAAGDTLDGVAAVDGIALDVLVAADFGVADVNAAAGMADVNPAADSPFTAVDTFTAREVADDLAYHGFDANRREVAGDLAYHGFDADWSSSSSDESSFSDESGDERPPVLVRLSKQKSAPAMTIFSASPRLGRVCDQ